MPTGDYDGSDRDHFFQVRDGRAEKKGRFGGPFRFEAEAT
jgi:hypothetical protein